MDTPCDKCSSNEKCENNACVIIPEDNPCDKCTSQEDFPNNRCVPDRVDTTWLKENGHENGILIERKAGNVLCIPDENIPCGTHRDILRQCDYAKCSLKTYEEISILRKDCYLKTVPVSRLRSSYDWSHVKISDTDTKTTLTLISLSKLDNTHSETVAYISHCFIYIGDVINQFSGGHLVDFTLLSILSLLENKAAFFGCIITSLIMTAGGTLLFSFF